MIANLTRIAPQTAQSFRDVSSGFKFEVVGDGRVDQSIADRFSSPAFLESVDDRRFRQLLKDQAEIAKADLPKAESTQRLQDSLTKLLGQGWNVTELSAGGGGQGINCVPMRFNEPTAGEQVIYLSAYENPRNATLTTNVILDGWQVSHSITGPQDGSQWTEGARFQKG